MELIDQPIVIDLTKLEEQSQEKIKDWDKVSGEIAEVIEKITGYSKDNIKDILIGWKELQALLFTKYADGYINLQHDSSAKDIGYSAPWLARTNYSNGPTTYDMITEN